MRNRIYVLSTIWISDRNNWPNLNYFSYASTERVIIQASSKDEAEAFLASIQTRDPQAYTF
jgi:hypothetical protein